MKKNIPILAVLLSLIPFTKDFNIDNCFKITEQYEQDKTGTLFNSFLREDVLVMDIKTDLTRLIKDKMKKEYQPGTIRYTDKNGNEESNQVEIQPRGNFKLKNCYFPPLKIRFISQNSTVRMVTGCTSNDTYQQSLIREYIAYKFYSVLTDLSFRIQLVKLRLEDSEGKENPMETFGFIIEDKQEMADRNSMLLQEVKNASEDSFKPGSSELLSIFHFMIGNTDWNLKDGSNITFIGETEKELIPVPYDFDHSGFVNAPYATHYDKIPISSVRERFFMGTCDQNSYASSIQLCLDKKDELLRIVGNCKPLSKSSEDYVLSYLERSFQILENDTLMEKEMNRGCSWMKMHN